MHYGKLLLMALFSSTIGFAMNQHKIVEEGNDIVSRYELNPQTGQWVKTEDYNRNTGTIRYYEAKIGGGRKKEPKYYNFDKNDRDKK